MNRPEPIELENNLGPDAVTGEINRVPWKAYDVDEMDLYIAEKDAEIERLKKAISNGDVNVMGWIDRCQELEEKIEMLKNSNAELKKKLEDVNELIKTARQMLEDAKASHYAEMVDAGMENNILKRALWLTRALRARDIQRWWLQVTCSPRTTIACRKWNNVERKCRAKEEQYK